ncbi:MAG: hypothetical protein QXI27_04715 [Nitrososphaerota archaeon]
MRRLPVRIELASSECGLSEENTGIYHGREMLLKIGPLILVIGVYRRKLM